MGLEIKGFTYGYDGQRGDYRTPEAEKSVERLAALGGNWAALAFTVCQDTYCSTRISPDYRFTVTDADIRTAVKRLRENGLKVCLKPIVNCSDGVWRAYIGFPETQWGESENWKKWFDSYTAFLCHYAEIAEETGCAMFCVGCEMLGTEMKEDYWRRTIAAVREVYRGPLVYNTNHGKELGVRWWDAVDFIGTSAYYEVGSVPGDSMENMEKAWDAHKQQLSEVSRLNGNKRIIFMEIGCRSALGCAMMPYDFTHREFPYSEKEQANFYESCLRSFSGEPWFAGMFWWDWYTKLPDQSPEMGFSIAGKKAEQVVQEWYRRK